MGLLVENEHFRSKTSIFDQKLPFRKNKDKMMFWTEIAFFNKMFNLEKNSNDYFPKNSLEKHFADVFDRKRACEV